MFLVLLLVIFVVGLFFGACIFCFKFLIYRFFMVFKKKKMLELQFFFYKLLMW